MCWSNSNRAVETLILCPPFSTASSSWAFCSGEFCPHGEVPCPLVHRGCQANPPWTTEMDTTVPSKLRHAMYLAMCVELSFCGDTNRRGAEAPS